MTRCITKYLISIYVEANIYMKYDQGDICFRYLVMVYVRILDTFGKNSDCWHSVTFNRLRPVSSAITPKPENTALGDRCVNV